MVEATVNGLASTVQDDAPKRTYLRYDTVHTSIAQSYDQLKAAGFERPDFLVAISGGGLIPARILRSILRTHAGEGKGKVATIKVIGLELYDDDLDGKPHESGVQRTQWLSTDGGDQLAGKTILIVDEVDDSRTTLAFAVEELLKDIRHQEDAIQASTGQRPSTKLGAYVVHNKQRPKRAQLPEGVPEFVAQHIAGSPWLCYPWDAVDIAEHNRLSASS